ncbi:Pyridoxamine 5'-phosphate oxidase [Polystyrenella longa]|uniref:Pyridoxamine 5'-phosphate oxidase n=1 Tax=Polystyrenella longa TaxID=2528007 RepID=A0A518CPL5_9PLAN|nr:pyridoxamine 5'-phosphate oxidase family protein [Polystyrenella longa]QDU81169.1 Pyridoxamine 5'-phosphate oxidase [Polystyrenella longa]
MKQYCGAVNDSSRKDALITAFHSLDQIESSIWKGLSLAPTEVLHPWRLPALGTNSEEGCELRTVVLRSCDAATRTLYAHTDLRSPKVLQVEQHSRTCWLFYHPEQRTQLRIIGRTQIHHQDTVADQFWTESDPTSLNLYRAPHPPGTVQPGPDPNLPLEIRGRKLSREEVEPGRDIFVVMATRIESIDWLRLDQAGSLRALFKWDDENQRTANWISP